ncbi:uncharacterized protein BDCG_08197 [Blastomyces dermatitidis ER-3]|uniref:Cyclic nucleotide-binding domain-containing protein n=1 Tax=Ajellomyces dermatitidis (strain ER-3 / ATCC MYA-2586) TaxID=559297 RepID=A0ABP2ETF3_AJEDR|nr:uncharacterized protein BDCG_08197 [Blastomyces dermatitidis ER-3]EEQ84928.2 hypothetical protein BDCG_08197 [Blastomyces dermatitidis ER-3]
MVYKLSCCSLGQIQIPNWSSKAVSNLFPTPAARIMGHALAKSSIRPTLLLPEDPVRTDSLRGWLFLVVRGVIIVMRRYDKICATEECTKWLSCEIFGLHGNMAEHHLTPVLELTLTNIKGCQTLAGLDRWLQT